MRHSIATVSVSGTLNEKIAAIAAAGFDGIELFEPDLVASPMSPGDVAAMVSDFGMSVELYQPFRDFEAMPEREFRRNMRRAEAKFKLMQTLGVNLILVCSNVNPDAIDDPDLAAGQLYKLGDLAAAFGIKVAYEALAWGTNVRHYRDAYDIVLRAAHPAVGVCLDSFHILSVGDSLAGLGDFDGESILFVQLADAPHLPMDVLRLSRHYRCFPGQGVLDLPRFTADALRAGYRGPLSLEVFSDTVRAAPAAQTAMDARRSLRYLEAVTEVELQRNDPDLLASSPGITLARLAPVPRIDGVAFIEVAVAEKAMNGFTALLAAFGFTIAGRHRSKAVTLWEQGDIRLVLNCDRPTDNGPSVVALGLHTPDVQSAVQRAADLRLSFNDQPHGAGEAELPSINTPMGLQLFFCTAAGPQAWRADFTEVDAGGDDRSVGLSVVDHVGGSVSPDLYDAEISLYRLLLGMSAGPVAEINQPHGQLRSRALISPGERLRVAISAGVVGRPTAPGLQQIALATPDVKQTIAALHAGGAPMLAIPDNYYADLATRYEIAPPELERMRSLGLLYDRSEAGEFVHAYSASIDGLFFEFVQRIGDYTGFGESDASVRLASQESGQQIIGD